MIVVRNCFVAKPGMGSKLAAQMKEAATSAGFGKYRVLTDLTGEFNRVVLEYEEKDLAGFETQMKKYATDESFRAKMKGYTEMYVTGYREIMTIV